MRIKKKFMSWYRYLFPRISKDLFFDCLTKKKGLDYHIKTTRTLVLGSSHAKLGFDTNLVQNSFNLGTDNQDLYTAYSLIKEYIPKLKNLKTIILFYSLFSQGFELDKTKSYRDIVLHHYIFNISYSSKCISRYKRAYHHRIKKFNDSGIDYSHFYGYIPNKSVGKSDIDFTKNRVIHHLRENKRLPSQHKFLDLIMQLCIDYNIQLQIVIAPVRDDFIQELSKNNSLTSLFQELTRWADKNKIKLKNYISSKFDDNCFKDCDHLNEKGAQKLTQKIINDFKLN